MSLKSEINQLINEIINEECEKENPVIKKIINQALIREMSSDPIKRDTLSKHKIISDYDRIVSNALKIDKENI